MVNIIHGFINENSYPGWIVLKQNIDDYLLFLKNNFQIYSKDYSEDHLAMHIFEPFVFSDKYPQYLKYEMNGVINTITEEVSEFNNLLGDSDNNKVLIDKKVQFMLEMLKESFFVFYRFNDEFSKLPIQKSIQERNLTNSLELLSSCRDHLYRYDLSKNSFSYFVDKSASILILRQAIEIKIKNALGIILISDEDHGILKLTPDFFIDFLYNNPNIKMPDVRKSVLKKIHKWCNTYVHAGIMLESWKIRFALKLINPLFMNGKKNGNSSIYGAIKMRKIYYENQLQADLVGYIQREKSKYTKINIIMRQHPEVLLY